MRHGSRSYPISVLVLIAFGLVVPAAHGNTVLSSSQQLLLSGDLQGDGAGASVAGGADINDDGRPDAIIGAPGSSGVTVAYGRPAPRGGGLDLVDPGADGLRVTGTGAAGSQVDAAGDVNGDGIDDFVIAAPDADTAYVVYGADAADPADVDLASLGTRGLAITGAPVEDVAGAGDVNGDGSGDVIVGASTTQGTSWIVYGATAADPADVDLSGAPHRVRRLLGGNTGDQAQVVSSAGDLNDDGIDDVVVGAPGRRHGTATTGGAYVVFGEDAADAPDVALDSLGSHGIALKGAPDGAAAGASVAHAGDVNGDGHSDILVGAPGVGAADETGAVYVVYGADALPEALDLSDLGVRGARLNGNPMHRSGREVAGAGDLNEDGIDDLVVVGGRYYTDVWFGKNGDLDAGYAIVSEDRSKFASADGVGDWDGDGRDDLVLGQPSEDIAWVMQGGSNRADVNPDGAGVEEDGATVVDVSANDVDSDGGVNPLAVTRPPAEGTATVVDGGIEYRPRADYCGADSFTYQAGSSQSATVALAVRCVNDAPDAMGETLITAEETTLVFGAPDLLTNDSDRDGDALSVVLKAAPSHGRMSRSDNGDFVYTPDENYNGTDSFTYLVSDGQANSGEVTAGIRVRPTNDAPVPHDDTASLHEDEILEVPAPGLLANDVDLDGDDLDVNVVTPPAHGDLTVTEGGGYIYTPEPEYNGTDSFTYELWDGHAESAETATVLLEIARVNDKPQAVTDEITVEEDSAATPVFALDNDTDVDGGDAFLIFGVGKPRNGTAERVGFQYVTYKPARDYCNSQPGGEPDEFTYELKHGSVGRVRARVECVDDVPVAVDDAASTDQGTPVTIGVAGNDEDIDGGPRSVASLGQGAAGAVAVGDDGASVVYTPAPGYCNTQAGGAPDSFTYGLNGGSRGIVRVVVRCPAPLTPGGATPQDTQPPAVAPPGGGQLTTALLGGANAGTVTASRSGGVTLKKLTARCGDGGPCTFTVTALSGKRTLATGKVVLAKGASGPMTLTLNRAGRKLLAKKRSLVLKVSVVGTDDGGARVTKTVTLKVKPAKKRR
jgi:VCBS repeat-containing protein